MYIPKTFRKENSEQIFEFIKENSFATLISTSEEQSFASHIPIDLININGEIYLAGHLSKANTQLSSLSKNKNVLIIFLGANHYISPKWYNHENVPTWNYIAVQVKGKIELVTEREELINFLSLQIDKYEDKVKSDLKLSHLSNSFLERELKGIVGFKISINNIDIAYKLSQNRNKINYLNIITELQKLNTSSSNLLASEMQLEYVERKIIENYKEIKFKICSSEDMNKIFTLRKNCFPKKKDYLLSLHSGEEKVGQDEYDIHSIICKVETENKLIGSCRITPLSKLNLESFMPYQSANNVLFSRVCIEDEHRNKNLQIFMFYKFSQWILNHTDYTDYFAFCTYNEYRLYKKLGAKKITENQITLCENQKNGYYIVKGNINKFTKLITKILN